MNKFFIYRNLHKQCFSVRFRGKVIDYQSELIASNVTFKVNKAGREKVLLTKCKNVHAFVVCDGYIPLDKNNTEIISEQFDRIVSYNPYKSDKFFDTNNNFISQADIAFLRKDGKVMI